MIVLTCRSVVRLGEHDMDNQTESAHVDVPVYKVRSISINFVKSVIKHLLYCYFFPISVRFPSIVRYV